MPNLFPNAWQTPGVQDTLDTITNQFWWGKFDLQVVVNVFLDGNSVDSGNTPTTLLRPGLLLGLNPTTNKWKQWSPTATDGTQFISGVLLYDQRMTDASGTAQDRFFGYAIVGGLLKANQILIPGNASNGIIGDALEFLVRAQLTQGGRFMFDDNYTQDMNGGWTLTATKTADYTVVAADNNTLFNTVGAAGAVNFTLPAPKPGLRFGFFAAVDQNLVITAAAAGDIIAPNNAAAASVTFSTAGSKIGSFAEVVGIRTGSGTAKWALGLLTPNTATIA